MSSTSSRPTATRIIPCVMPAARRCSSVRRPCDVLAGCVMVVFVSPRLAVIEQTSVASMTWKAFFARDRRTVVAAAHDERDHGAAAARLLRHRQLVLRMRREARVVDALDLRLALEPGREDVRPLALCAHPDRQRLEALQHDPGVERRQRHAGTPHDRHETLVDDALGRADRAGDDPALPVEVLGAGVDHQVCAVLDRSLQRRRAETVVDGEPGTGVLRNRRQGSNVADLGQRIGRRLGEQQLACSAGPHPATGRRRSARRRSSRRRTSRTRGRTA